MCIYVCICVCAYDLNVCIPLQILGGPNHMLKRMITARVTRDSSKTVKNPQLPPIS